MTKEEAIIAAKTFRKDADELLQRMKEHKARMMSGTSGVGGQLMSAAQTAAMPPPPEKPNDFSEMVAQHMLSVRDLESCIMRQGMVLKAIGTPTPYPNSYNPGNTVVDPTADKLKL